MQCYQSIPNKNPGTALSVLFLKSQTGSFSSRQLHHRGASIPPAGGETTGLMSLIHHERDKAPLVTVHSLRGPLPGAGFPDPQVMVHRSLFLSILGLCLRASHPARQGTQEAGATHRAGHEYRFICIIVSGKLTMFVVYAHSFLDGSFKQDQPKQHLLFICVLINSCWTNYCMTALMSSQSDGKDLRCFLRGFFFLKVVTCNLFHLYAYEICWRFGPNGREPDRICIKLPPSALFKLLHELQWYHSRGCRFVLGKKNPPRLWWVKT